MPNCEQSCTSSVEVDNVTVQISIADSEKAADIGHSFSINCTVTVTGIVNNSDSLTLMYQWYKDKRSLPGTRVSMLKFGALTPSDSGSYVCEVFIRSNSQGNQGIIRPSLPYNLNISSEY